MDEILLPPEIENKIKLWALRAIEKFGMPDSFFQKFDGILQEGESVAEAKIRFKNLHAELEKSKITSADKGVNILLYGLPGTGKTEFVKMIAAELNRNLYEIASKSRYTDDNYSGEKRFLSLKTADKVLNKERDIIMFDEIEDVFKGTERMSKALFNSTLESNSVPTFWITNDIDEIDNAYIRRFDIVIEFKIPPKFKRLEILKRYANGQVSEELLKKLAKNRAITPALISGATKVVSNLSHENKDEAFKNLIKSSLKAQGFVTAKKKGKKDKNKEINLPQNYDVSLINASANLKELAKGIKESKNARLCLYGPAGTGKSAYAKFITKSLNSKLIIKKASDLIDCYVGNTEKNIANAFKEAKDQNAVLVFDEIDSFLQDRSDAVRKWEITQVNEMLVQMESFEGIFIATTNLMNSLDRASIRRFDMKVEFGYMDGTQAAKLLQKECESLGLSVDKTAKNSVAKIKFLTPGDFATVARSAKFSPILNASEFIDRLNKEIKHKNIENNGRIAGFKG